ncbi:hypothetical protein QC763_0059610 [Podospora pseudopauciseta]|uniref:DUF7025 domain-containing protein n=1 Tax=Podospora pseudopauciseta TaxID=2093780 RepID=A0ABR0HID8_9PEZI|nr:hypothetical protein QC763_0059610 [Podospora pseudopauciseta]
MEWEDSAAIYCPKNGRSHVGLLEFGYWECPLCNQDLSEKPLKQAAGLEDEDEDDGTSGGRNPKISHSLEYLDSGENRIAAQAWSGSFDLQTARKGILEKKPSVFNIVTLLKTSHLPQKHRYEYEVREILRTGILNNPNISVNVLSTRVTINSQALINALGAVVSYYPGISFGGKVLELKEPYAVVAHHLSALEDYQKTSRPKPCDKETFDHLGLLLGFLRTSVYKDKIRLEQERYSRNACTFQMLWLLFKPGDTVYVEFRGKLSAFVVQEVATDNGILSDFKHTFKSYEIRLWSLRYDGRFVGRSSTEMIIPHFDGERPITTLKVFPCRFVDDEDGGKMKSMLEESGKRWYDLLRGQQVHYKGEFVEKRKDNDVSKTPDDEDDDKPWYVAMVNYLKGTSRRDNLDAPRDYGQVCFSELHFSQVCDPDAMTV